jgi:hypothetical protein
VEKLRRYVSKGGTILLVGSNGVFDASFKKNAESIRTLVPQLSDRQLQVLYDWGLQNDIRVPFIVVSANGNRFIEVLLKGDPAENYRQLRAALPITLGLSENGQFFLSSLYNSTPRQGKNFIKDFDVNEDGIVSRKEFPGPDEVFNRLDINRDGVITKEEAEADGTLPSREK